MGDRPSRTDLETLFSVWGGKVGLVFTLKKRTGLETLFSDSLGLWLGLCLGDGGELVDVVRP